MNIKLRLVLAALVVLVSACAFASDRFHRAPRPYYPEQRAVMLEIAMKLEAAANHAEMQGFHLPSAELYFRGRAEAYRASALIVRGYTPVQDREFGTIP